MTDTIASFIGSYAGGLVLTFFLTRLAHYILRAMSSGILRSIIVFVTTTIFSLGVAGITMGFGEATIIYFPCLLVWLIYDLFKARRQTAKDLGERR